MTFGVGMKCFADVEPSHLEVPFLDTCLFNLLEERKNFDVGSSEAPNLE